MLNCNIKHRPQPFTTILDLSNLKASRLRRKFHSGSNSALLTLNRRALVFKCLQCKSFETIVFCTLLENCLPFSSNLKLSSENSLSLEQSKMCRLGKG